MANREVSLFLKYPGPPVTLQRLQHSFLECVIEYKSGSAGELQTTPPSQLRSLYQLKGTITLVDDELVIQFAPKHAGLHSVRIFSDTRELCRPVAFIVNHNNEVESTSYDHPVKTSSSLFNHYVKRQSQYSQQAFPSQYPQQVAPTPPHYISPGVSPRESAMLPPRDRDSFWKDFPIDPSGDLQEPSLLPQTSPQHRMSSNMARQSYISSSPLAGRPVSMEPTDEATYAGDLFTGQPDGSNFNSLYAAKKNGQQVYGKKKMFMAVDHGRAVTHDTFKMLEKDINSLVTKGHKGKQRCTICNNKFKMSKIVEMGEEEYCESCFRRQFTMRSAIEHFMVPSIQECTVEVPVNKKATKFITARKTLPNVNLRGLEPNEIKFAMQEFRKFSPEENGWISKAVLVPLMKACIAYNLSAQEIKSLLSSKALQSVITSYGLDEREEVHEIEFLALLAFIARERQRLRTSADPKNKFTGSDLQLAYAFRNQFGTQRQAPSNRPRAQQPSTVAGKRVQRPAYVTQDFKSGGSSRFRTSSAPPPQGFSSQVPLRQRESHLQQQQYRESQVLARESSLFAPTRTIMSPIGENDANPQFSGPQSEGPISSTHVPSGFRSKPPSQYDFTELQQPQAQFPQLSGMQLGSSPEHGYLAMGQGESGEGVFPEDREMPTLPPNKDPSGQTISRPILNKKQPNKQMMEELKLTGGQADSWMMY